MKVSNNNNNNVEFNERVFVCLIVNICTKKKNNKNRTSILTQSRKLDGSSDIMYFYNFNTIPVHISV